MNASPFTAAIELLKKDAELFSGNAQSAEMMGDSGTANYCGKKAAQDYAAIRVLEQAGGEPIQSARTWLGLWALKGGDRNFYITETGADILERIYDFLSLAALPDPVTKEGE